MAAKLPTFDELLETVVESYRSAYGKAPELAACAPGRVNLIGEHIDYCDGFVLPMVSVDSIRLIQVNLINYDNCFPPGRAQQALPMVTMIVGSRNGTSNECNITTLCEGVDAPNHIQFATDNLRPGLPK